MQIIAARHLQKTGRGIASPFVEVEVVGCEYDVGNKYKTSTKGNYDISIKINLFIFLVFNHLLILVTLNLTIETFSILRCHTLTIFSFFYSPNISTDPTVICSLLSQLRMLSTSMSLNHSICSREI